MPGQQRGPILPQACPAGEAGERWTSGQRYELLPSAKPSKTQSVLMSGEEDRGSILKKAERGLVDSSIFKGFLLKEFRSSVQRELDTRYAKQKIMRHGNFSALHRSSVSHALPFEREKLRGTVSRDADTLCQEPGKRGKRK